jgi:hypothetical protein
MLFRDYCMVQERQNWFGPALSQGNTEGEKREVAPLTEILV